ncbi:MAG TPA: hypothetical protein ACFCUY_08350 [Xenococcaceae cyanobacterium]|jgi:hypothetical protein
MNQETLKFIYRGIKYHSELKDRLDPEIITVRPSNRQLKTKPLDLFTYRGISYTKSDSC